MALAAGAGPARADVDVRLTTGGVIRAVRAHRVGDRVEIVTTSGTMTLPAAKVASIEQAAARPGRADRLNVDGSAAPEAATPRRATAAPASSAMREGTAWSRLPSLAPLVRGGDLRAAEEEARRQLVASPGDPVAGIALGEILVARAKLSEAVVALRSVAADRLADPLRRARDVSLADALGRLQRVEEALAVLQATPDDGAGTVAAARQALKPDEGLGDRPFGSSAHFVLVGPPGTRPLQMESLLDDLEAIHAGLQRELGGAPTDRVRVVLYPGDDFWEATGTGASVGALFDGTMRIPAGRVSPPSPGLQAALRHEMAHAFVEALSGARADVRWHEGIAEHFEGSDCGPTVRALKESLRRDPDAWPPAVSHATSHARLEWFLARWGMASVRDVLSGMASRGTIDAAVRAATGLDEAELDAAWKRDLLHERSAR